MSTVWSPPRRAPLIGGPLDGNRVWVWATRGHRRGGRGIEPAVITLAHGCTDAEPWPHAWVDYQRRSDGTYHWPHQEAS